MKKNIILSTIATLIVAMGFMRSNLERAPKDRNTTQVGAVLLYNSSTAESSTNEAKSEYLGFISIGAGIAGGAALIKGAGAATTVASIIGVSLGGVVAVAAIA